LRRDQAKRWDTIPRRRRKVQSEGRRTRQETARVQDPIKAREATLIRARAKRLQRQATPGASSPPHQAWPGTSQRCNCGDALSRRVANL